MKTIRIDYVDFPGQHLGDFDKESTYFTRMLQRHFKVEISPEPDFVFCSGRNYDFLHYDCPRIFWTGENIRPNFNLYDYAFGFDWMVLEDRYYRLPLYKLYTGFEKLVRAQPNPDSARRTKTRFCDFIYSNNLGDGTRDSFYHKLTTYKPVSSAGKHLNNTGEALPGGDLGKLTFQQSSKFSIAFENTSTPGYTTEKLTQPFLAYSIPIYWGNPSVERDFNTRAFINCHQFRSFDAVLDEVARIDQDENLYRSMLEQPIFHNNQIPDYLTDDKISAYLAGICSQPREKAFRRHRRMHELDLEQEMQILPSSRRGF